MDSARVHVRLLTAIKGASAGWWVHLLIFTLVTAMWYPTLFEGKSLIFGDSVDHGLPLLSFFKAYLHGSESPLWVKEIYGGHPLFAEGQGGFAEPLNLFVAWAFPPIFGNNVFHYICMLVSGAGVVRLCRTLGLSYWSAGFAALAVIFSGYWLYLQHNLTVSGALMWVPWAFYSFELWLKSPNLSRAVWMALFGTMLILAGYPQICHGLALFAVCSIVIMPFCNDGRLLFRRHRRAYIFGGALAAFLCAGLSAVQLLPLLELVKYSHRSGGVAIIFQQHLLNYVRGMLFQLDERTQVPAVASILVCMLGSLSILFCSSCRMKGYIVGTCVTMLLGMGRVTELFRLIYDANLIPGLHYFRIMFIYFTIGTVGLAVLAACAIDALPAWLSTRRHMTKWSPRVWSFLFVFFGFWLAIDILSGTTKEIAISLVIVFGTVAVIMGLTSARRESFIPVAVFGVLALECLTFSVRHIRFYDPSILTHHTVLDDLKSTGSEDGRFFTVSIADVYGLVDSRWPGLSQLVERAVGSDQGLSNLLRGDSSLNGALALQLYNRDILTEPLLAELAGKSSSLPGLRLIDLLNIRYITADDELHTSGLKAIGTDPLGFWLMENTQAKPSVQVYTHAVGAPSADESLAMIQKLTAPALVVQTDSDTSSKLPADDRQARDPADVQLSVKLDHPNLYVMDIRAPFACWIFIADANYPGWYATVDGVDTTVWTAQVLGKAIHVDAGNHRVVVGFRSMSFFIGLGISLLSLLITIGLLTYQVLAASGRKRAQMDSI